jgi:tRNA threonylcarbamoyladenosine biosynthesis protein TsaB
VNQTLLAIESSTDHLSVALLRGDQVLVLHEDAGSRQHASALLPSIDHVLREVGIDLDQLDGIGVAIGPGSFTSLRIGLATVKGLAFGRTLATVGVSTLEAMALGWFEANPDRGERDVVALLDARRGEWYAGGWAKPPGARDRPVARLPEGLYSPQALATRLGEDVVAMCPETEGWAASFEAAGWRVSEIVSGLAARPRADHVGRLAQRQLARGERIDARELAARYLRRAEAEAKRLGGPVEAGEVARVEDPSS